jgi:hypothetical protein
MDIVLVEWYRTVLYLSTCTVRVRVRVKVNCASLRYKWSTAPVKFGF